jgi:site-specific recombinase XerD
VFFQDVGMSVKSLAQRTREEYTHDVSELIEFLDARGLTELDKVRLRHLQMYSHALEKRALSRSSRNRKVDAIKSFFRFLHEQEVIRHDPADQLIPPPPVEREPRILTEEEYQRLLSTCAAKARDQAIIVLYLQTGMRLSELVRLKVSDIELPNDISPDAEHAGFVRVTRSNGRTERIPLNYKACAALVAYLKNRPAVASPTLFLNRFDAPLSRRRVQYFVKEYLESIGIRDASVHTLRHTMAAHHVAQGTDLQVIQETLGISLEATEKYLSLAKKTARRALQEHAL